MEHIIESTKTTEFFFRGKNGTLEITSRREHHFNHAAKRYHLYDLCVSFLKACDELPRELFTTKSGELNAALFDSVFTVVASESFKSKTLITPTLKVASSNLVSRTTSSQAMYRLRRHFYALHQNVVVRSRRCDSFQNCNHYVGLQFCCLGCGLFDMFWGN